jgi:5-formyltetrahydrofolate cyclo-ligase
VACYLANDGELDPALLVRRLRSGSREVYLPVLDGPMLRFAPWAEGETLRRNRFGIPEPPRRGHARGTIGLDVILVPLVAFDDAGNRLGMGGGFYDRTLARLARRRAWRRPRLVGVAYGFQQVQALPARSWDVPLCGVVTDRGYHIASRSGQAPASEE